MFTQTRIGYNHLLTADGEPVYREDGRVAQFTSDFEPAEFVQHLPAGEYRLERYPMRYVVTRDEPGTAPAPYDPPWVPATLAINGVAGDVYEGPAYESLLAKAVQLNSGDEWRSLDPDVIAEAGATFKGPDGPRSFPYEIRRADGSIDSGTLDYA